MSRLCLAAIVLASPHVAAADGLEPRAYAGLGASFAADGGGAHGNPLTTGLVYLPISGELGYRLTRTIGLHLSAGVGRLVGNETEGHIVELLAGPEAVWRTGDLELGVGVDGGYAHLDYGFKEQATSLDALVIEPRAILAYRRSRRWSLRVHLGPRSKWIAGKPDRNPQLGFVAGVDLAIHFSP